MRVKVRFSAGEREHVEIWRNQQLVQLAKPVSIPTRIDFSRKPALPAEESGIAYEGSMNYRLRLTARARRDMQAEPEARRSYLTEPELAELMSATLRREFSELERVEVAKFFLRNAPVSFRSAVEALEMAVTAKGAKMHLRFYFHTIEQQLNKKRS